MLILGKLRKSQPQHAALFRALDDDWLRYTDLLTSGHPITHGVFEEPAHLQVFAVWVQDHEDVTV